MPEKPYLQPAWCYVCGETETQLYRLPMDLPEPPKGQMWDQHTYCHTCGTKRLKELQAK